MSKTLEELQKEIVFEARKGFPLLLSGVIVFLISPLCPYFSQ